MTFHVWFPDHQSQTRVWNPSYAKADVFKNADCCRDDCFYNITCFPCKRFFIPVRISECNKVYLLQTLSCVSTLTHMYGTSARLAAAVAVWGWFLNPVWKYQSDSRWIVLRIAPALLTTTAAIMEPTPTSAAGTSAIVMSDQHHQQQQRWTLAQVQFPVLYCWVWPARLDMLSCFEKVCWRCWMWNCISPQTKQIEYANVIYRRTEV